VSNYDFHASIGYWITITSHAYQQTIDAELRPYGITFRQFQVMGWLMYEGRLTQSELAKRMMIEPPTLAGILTRMEAIGWVTRIACSSDRRRKFIEVGPESHSVWEKVVACLNKVRADATQDMTPEEVDQLVSLLSRVLGNLGQTSEIDIPLPSIATEKT
jgi:MarR family transcriptional regulator for hemolysin